MAAPGQLAPGVLTHQAIESLCDFVSSEAKESQGRRGPIRRCKRVNLRSASYDLRLGSEYYIRKPGEGGSRKLETQRLAPDNALVIDPNSVAVVTALEEVVLDRDMIARLSLKMDLLLNGLIMASQSQLDAGYRGQVFALLYNLSDAAVTLRHGQSILRIEFTRLPEKTDKPYDGDYQQATLGQVLGQPIGSSLDEMRQKVDEADDRLRKTRIWGALVALVAILVPIGLLGYESFYGSIDDLKQRTARIEGQLENPENIAPSPTVREACQEIERLAQRTANDPQFRC